MARRSDKRVSRCGRPCGFRHEHALLPALARISLTGVQDFFGCRCEGLRGRYKGFGAVLQFAGAAFDERSIQIRKAARVLPEPVGLIRVSRPARSGPAVFLGSVGVDILPMNQSRTSGGPSRAGKPGGLGRSILDFTQIRRFRKFSPGPAVSTRTCSHICRN